MTQRFSAFRFDFLESMEKKNWPKVTIVPRMHKSDQSGLFFACVHGYPKFEGFNACVVLRALTKYSYGDRASCNKVPLRH